MATLNITSPGIWHSKLDEAAGADRCGRSRGHGGDRWLEGASRLGGASPRGEPALARPAAEQRGLPRCSSGFLRACCAPCARPARRARGRTSGGYHHHVHRGARVSGTLQLRARRGRPQASARPALVPEHGAGHPGGLRLRRAGRSNPGQGPDLQPLLVGPGPERRRQGQGCAHLRGQPPRAVRLHGLPGVRGREPRPGQLGPGRPVPGAPGSTRGGSGPPQGQVGSPRQRAGRRGGGLRAAVLREAHLDVGSRARQRQRQDSLLHEPPRPDSNRLWWTLRGQRHSAQPASGHQDEVAAKRCGHLGRRLQC
mmetsp:Transcript_24473/g.73028  ORF Transcript_24473/g.73028 Transcript_24473/m.73028 type:complete len:311 (+) Transcript_24473:107-1039(+)